MKRQLIFSIVAFAVIAKLFSVVMVKVRETSKQDVIGTALPFDQMPKIGLNNPSQNNQVAQSHLAREKARPVRTYSTPIKSLDFTKKPKRVAALDKKKAKIAALEKKESDRRKKRRKKIEEMTAKKAVAQPKLTILINGGKKRTSLADLDYSDSTPSPQQFYPMGDSSGTATPPVVSQGEPPKPEVDLTRWINLLLNNPKPRDMNSFITLYHSGAITAAQFYQVVGLMQKSSNLAVRKFAVTGASIEPHKLAFEILSEVASLESNVELHDEAVRAVNKYQDIKFLDIMADSLTEGNLYAKIKASDTVNATALAFKESTPNQDPRIYFQRFVAILQNVINDQNSTPQLVSSAKTTLATINSIISTAVAGL